MKRVIIIEDRPWRQKRILSLADWENLRQMENVYMPEEDDCRGVIQEINEGDTSRLDAFDLIIVHKTVLKTYGAVALSAHCKKQQKDLVLFTGNQDQSSFSQADHPLLVLGSDELYSEDLVPFLNEYTLGNREHLLEVLLGQNWELSLLLNYRQLLSKLETEENFEVRIRLEEEINELRKSLDIDALDVNEEILKRITSI